MHFYVELYYRHTNKGAGSKENMKNKVNVNSHRAYGVKM